MTRASLIKEISLKTGIDRAVVSTTLEQFMKTVKGTMIKGENVYLRGFGSFVVKRRAEKLGRIITRNTSIVIPAHNHPTFKPVKAFAQKVAAGK